MKVLIVHSHPEEKSFSSALKNTAESFFSKRGDEVIVSDLYKMKFNPVGGKEDFTMLSNPDYFIYQLEQLNATNKNLYKPEIKTEIDKFLKSDIIIFNFPLWWFSLPAILKGWVDKVFAMGLTYGPGKGVYDKGIFKDKIAFCCITTGGPDFSYIESGFNGDINKILFHINHGMLYFVGMKVLPPFVAYSAARMSVDERKLKLVEYSEMLNNIPNITPIF